MICLVKPNSNLHVVENYVHILGGGEIGLLHRLPEYNLLVVAHRRHGRFVPGAAQHPTRGQVPAPCYRRRTWPRGRARRTLDLGRTRGSEAPSTTTAPGSAAPRAAPSRSWVDGLNVAPRHVNDLCEGSLVEKCTEIDELPVRHGQSDAVAAGRVLAEKWMPSVRERTSQWMPAASTLIWTSRRQALGEGAS
jgi:hypothetical protein